MYTRFTKEREGWNRSVTVKRKDMRYKLFSCGIRADFDWPVLLITNLWRSSTKQYIPINWPLLSSTQRLCYRLISAAVFLLPERPLQRRRVLRIVSALPAAFSRPGRSFRRRLFPENTTNFNIKPLRGRASIAPILKYEAWWHKCWTMKYKCCWYMKHKCFLSKHKISTLKAFLFVFHNTQFT